MKELIDKAAVVAAIKTIYNEDYKFLPSDLVESVQDFKDDLLIALDTLDVKEVDLEKEYEEFVVDDPIFGNFITNDTMGMELAKHFFELGLKTKGK